MNRYQFFSQKWENGSFKSVRMKVKLLLMYTQAMMRPMLQYWGQWMVVMYQRLQAVLLWLLSVSTRKHRDSVRGLIPVDPVLHRGCHSNGPRDLSIS